MSHHEEAPFSQVIQPASLAHSIVLGSPTFSVRVGFSAHHMDAAVKAARRAHEIEAANSGAAHGPWFGEMAHTVPVAIIMASAALEARVNEVIQDILEGYQPAQANEPQKILLKELKDSTSSDTIKKCRQALLVRGIAPDTGQSEWQETKLLLTLRNRLIHFRPVWDHENIHDSDWIRDLKKRVPIYAPFAEKFQFPYGFMTYGAAKWAVTTALTFAAHFTPLLGVPDRFAGQNYALP